MLLKFLSFYTLCEAMQHPRPLRSVIFVLIYFLVLVSVFQLFFRFSFSFSFANNQIISNLPTKTC